LTPSGAATFMMAMYALEQRHRLFVLGFAVGCALASSYGFLRGAWPSRIVEAIWTLAAFGRWMVRRSPTASPGETRVPEHR